MVIECIHLQIYFYIHNKSMHIHTKNPTLQPLLKLYAQVCFVKSNSSCLLVDCNMESSGAKIMVSGPNVRQLSRLRNRERNK